MSIIDRLDLLCMDFMCDDYEKASFIIDLITSAMGRRVDEDEINNRLQHLADQGLIDAFNEKFTRIPASKISGLTYFMTNENGNKVLDQYWDPEKRDFKI